MLCALSLLPLSEVPGVPGKESLGLLEAAKHPAAYFVVTAAGLKGWRGQGTAVVAGLALLGVTLEILQEVLPESFQRSMGVDDLAGNAVGIALAWAGAQALARRRRSA